MSLVMALYDTSSYVSQWLVQWEGVLSSSTLCNITWT